MQEVAPAATNLLDSLLLNAWHLAVLDADDPMINGARWIDRARIAERPAQKSCILRITCSSHKTISKDLEKEEPDAS